MTMIFWGKKPPSRKKHGQVGKFYARRPVPSKMVLVDASPADFGAVTDDLGFKHLCCNPTNQQFKLLLLLIKLAC